MTRICENCGFQNQDDYDYCAKCGTPLVEGLRPRQVYVVRAENAEINKKALLITYIVTILLSWGGVLLNLVFKHAALSAFTFFGFFLPFYLIQSPVREIKKHGLIQLIISVAGISLSFYIFIH
jgi:hypothetical protein